MQPGRTKYIPPPQPNVIGDEEGKEPTNFHHKVHRSPSWPHIIPPEVPIPYPNLNTAQPPRVETGGPSYNLRSRGNKNPRPRYALKVHCQKPREANSVTHQISGMTQEYRHLIKVPERKIQRRSFENKLGQLDQGIREFNGKNTVVFIPKSMVSKEKKVTYGEIVCEMKPEKQEKERMRLTVGENLLDSTGNLSAPIASVTTSKCVFNSVVSTPGTRSLLADINFFI